MLMKQPRPRVAERPDDLVVYGGTGKGRRAAGLPFDAHGAHAVHARRRRTMLVQSGKPVGVHADPMSGHPSHHRQLQTSSGTGTWPEFRRLEALGLTMYGQMTAGSWIYIGTQGILQGTYETFAAVAAKRFGARWPAP